CEKCLQVSFMSWGAGIKKSCPDSDYLKTLRDDAKSKFDYLRKNLGLFGENQQQIYEDIKDILPALTCLVSMVRDYDREYTRLKKKENFADFNDTLHNTIKLLCKRDENGRIIKDENGNPFASSLAKELSDGFTEIFVDEYQDVNEAQELLFGLLSRDGGNLFMVGDVKQSIYGFREAMPELFLEKQKTYAKYDGITYPSTVVLGTNFRSRSGVTENINHIFSRIMTEEIGGLEYNEDHYLYYNKDGYLPHDEPDTELHFVKNNENRTEAQVRYIVDYIEKNAGTLIVKDGDTSRPAQYGDFAVLLRSFDKNRDGFQNRLMELLNARGVPVVINADKNYFEAPEVRFMLSLMRTIQNPLDDVSLLAVMLSPVYGFTPDDAARIRIGLRRKKLFYAVQKAADDGVEKAQHLLDEIERFRNISYTVGAEELLHILLDETGFFSIVSVMPEAGSRVENLRQLCDYAAEYESAGRVGLTGFLRYIERAECTEIKAKSQESESVNAVNIMTIHKSKGLEFPVCIVANCGKQFNSQTKSICFARKCGIGLYSGGENFVRFDNILRTATRLENTDTEKAEELRVLYVALTRAKEKLLIVSAYSPDEPGGKYKAPFRLIDAACSETISPMSVLRASDSIDIIASALVNHPDAAALRESQTSVDPMYIDVDFTKTAKLRIVNADYEIKPEQNVPVQQPEEDLTALVREIAKRAEYVYPYAGLNGKPAKRVASDFAAAHEGGEFIATTVPAFLRGEELSSAQRGTATHKFMQFCSFETEDVGSELERVVEEGLMTRREADAVEKERIEEFLSCSLVKRINASPKVYREQRFTCGLSAGEVYPDLRGVDAQETVVVEGVADLAFEEDGMLVIVDYKTDRRVTDEILRGRYRGQLEIYARCLSELLNIKVKETMVYSFSLGKTVQFE
ncbi:MAG: UvrD-helicase domain-containing protein, partial [Clostridia bacterium]|nr:UvrD-helicase domain-containing protein [Clostridia bacterium]